MSEANLRPCILIIDDEEFVLSSLQRLLRPEFNVLGAGSAARGLELLRQHPVQVIITDQRMPGQTGSDFLVQIKNDFPDALRIILTAYADLESMIQAVNAGEIYRYLVKPWNPDELAATVREACEKYRLRLDNRQLTQNLLAANAELEQRVAARTAELLARTQELRLANETLHRAAHNKDDFFASMSHEIRTPLASILQTAEAFNLGVYGAAEARQLQAIQTMYESGQHLLALINDILDLSKIEAGKMELQIGPVPVNDVCQASLRMIKQTANQKLLRLSTHLDSAVPAVQADGRRLKQMLVNLLSNAVKFTPENGQVGLEVIGDEARQTVHFTVWDTGVGIAPENIGQLFQPFVQLNNPLASQTYGTGLGLSLVLRMAELHGGGVTVESQVDAGSRFTVSIPWHPAAGSQLKDQRRPAAPLPLQLPTAEHGAEAGRPLILIADDNALVGQTLSDFLCALSYQVVVVYDGLETVQMARKIQPSLILMDIQMPGISGLEAIRRLRAEANQPLAAVPIIALTALTMAGDREICLAAGANNYLAKPVILPDLAASIAALLKQG